MKAILIAGVPGTGKTTVMRRMIENLGGLGHSTKVVHNKIFQGHLFGDWLIPGIYDDPEEVFAGTDRLSMAVQPMFEDYIRSNKVNVLLEGDRLVGNSTIDFLLEQGYDVQLVVLTAPSELLAERYAKRGSNQPEQFLASKRTKVANISGRLDLMMEDKVERLCTAKFSPSEIAVKLMDLLSH